MTDATYTRHYGFFKWNFSERNAQLRFLVSNKKKEHFQLLIAP